MSVHCLLYTDQGKSVFLKTGKSVYPIRWEMLDAEDWVCGDEGGKWRDKSREVRENRDRDVETEIVREKPATEAQKEEE